MARSNLIMSKRDLTPKWNSSWNFFEIMIRADRGNFTHKWTECSLLKSIRSVQVWFSWGFSPYHLVTHTISIQIIIIFWVKRWLNWLFHMFWIAFVIIIFVVLCVLCFPPFCRMCLLVLCMCVCFGPTDIKCKKTVMWYDFKQTCKYNRNGLMGNSQQPFSLFGNV